MFCKKFLFFYQSAAEARGDAFFSSAF